MTLWVVLGVTENVDVKCPTLVEGTESLEESRDAANLIDILQVMFFGVMAKRAISDFEQFGGAGADPIGLLQGGLEIAALRVGDFFLEIEALRGEGDAGGDSGDSAAVGGVARDAVWKNAEGDFWTGFESHGALQGVF